MHSADCGSSVQYEDGTVLTTSWNGNEASLFLEDGREITAEVAAFSPRTAFLCMWLHGMEHVSDISVVTVALWTLNLLIKSQACTHAHALCVCVPGEARREGRAVGLAAYLRASSLGLSRGHSWPLRQQSWLFFPSQERSTSTLIPF